MVTKMTELRSVLRNEPTTAGNNGDLDLGIFGPGSGEAIVFVSRGSRLRAAAPQVAVAGHSAELKQRSQEQDTMKRWQIGAAIVGAGLSAVGLSAAVTNPGPEAYEEYASEQLATYLTDKCREATAESEGFVKLLQGSCGNLVRAGRPFLQDAISQGTDRQNYLFLSVYRTELAAPEFIPGAPKYRFETIGFYQVFVTRKAESL